MVAQFRWIIDGLLAGSGRPGLLNPAEEDWSFLRREGIRMVVSLTETALDPPPSHWGFAGIHFPISDMGTPASPRAADDLCRQVVASIQRREPVLLHCKAGVGRTGTMLACCLVALGRTAEEAVFEVRRLSHNTYIETPAQERFVHHYAAYLESPGRRSAAALPRSPDDPEDRR